MYAMVEYFMSLMNYRVFIFQGYVSPAAQGDGKQLTMSAGNRPEGSHHYLDV